MTLLRDLHYAVRTLRHSRGFATTTIALLALGIGASTAIFSVLYAVILRPLPYPESSRLVFIWQRFPGLPFGERMMVAPENYREWQRLNTSFQEMAAFRTTTLDETTTGSTGKVLTTFASATLFKLLGAEPRLGRLFRPEEEARREHVAVLTDAYFHRRFQADPRALGKALTLGEATYVVIGILPPGFYLPRTAITDQQPDVLLPLPDPAQNANEHFPLLVTARLRPTMSLTQARTEMALIASRLEKQQNAQTELYTAGTALLFPFSAENSDPSLNRALYLLMAAVALVLLIVCANLANLTLARATMRSREILVRLALGASRSSVVAQLLCESLMLAVAGAALGLLLAHWSIQFLLSLKPPDIERPQLIGINVPVLAFAAGAAALTATLFGLWPALLVSGADLASRLKTGGGWGASAVRLRSRQLLIVCEVALALMLLTGAGLMIRSLHQVAALGVGFDTSHLMALDLNLPEKRYPDGSMRARLIRDLIARAQAIPGVAAAAVTSDLPLHSVGMNAFHIPGRPEPTRDSAPISDTAQVSPGFFDVIGLRLEAGRWLTDADFTSPGAGKDIALINRAFVLKYFPDENPLGRKLQTGDKKITFEIVGIVADYRATGAENEARPEIFRPSLQLDSATLVVRTRAERQSVERSLLDAARSVAPDLAADKVKTLDEYAKYWTSQREFNTLLLEIFAGLALMLAVSGIYSVLSNMVASRTREIGIRMAIGASPAAISRLMVRQSMIPVAIGISIGLGAWIACGRFMQSLLFQVPAHDPLTLTATIAVILLISPAALWLPLRRATAIDCTVALRDE